MSNRIVNIENSHTGRRSYSGGNTPDEHRELLASGFRHDRMANQSRKSEIKREPASTACCRNRRPRMRPDGEGPVMRRPRFSDTT